MRVLYPQLAAIDGRPACASEVDVNDLDLGTVRVRQAEIEVSSIEDVDGDSVDDLLIQVDTNDLGGLGMGTTLWVYAVKNNSQVVSGEGAITWVSTTADTDGDGVRDGCDVCPAAAPAPDVDGCP
jgi:hypothetical protein